LFRSIKKRDGRIVEFDAWKITNAIAKAGKVTGEFGDAEAKRLCLKVLSLAETFIKDLIPSVEEIQDLVEEVLLASPYKKTAKAYIIYRDQHAKIRALVSRTNGDLMDRYLKKLDWQVNENSNMTYSLQGLNNYISAEITKTYWLHKIYPPEIRNAHLDGAFHIHDLSILSVYCVGWDLEDLLLEGFRGVPGKIESAPPKHFRSALGQITNFFYTLQGEAAGAQALSSIDTFLAPFIRYDDLSIREVKQAMQEFIFNMNVPTRVGFQTPFTNITLDTTPPSHFRDTSVIRGGKHQDETYGDYEEEIRLFNQAFLEIMKAGDAKGRVFTFPIPTYNITNEMDWDDPDYDILWEVTAKYGLPYFSNFVNSDMLPEDTRSMCCRLRLDTRELQKKGGGLFGANPLTGSIGVVTINLPRIGYLSRDDSEFFNHLDSLMHLAKESLIIKRKVLEGYTASNLYPYSKYYLRNVYERLGEYWKNHFSTIGLVGMNEALMNFMGETMATFEGRKFAINVLEYMRDRLVEFQEATGMQYNLEATPAEGTSYRLAKLDRARYPSILSANNSRSSEPYYTNSTQLPVGFTDDIFEALDLQDDLQSKYTGGTVFHMFIGEKIADPSGVKTLVKRICENYHLPYFTLTPTFSICKDHGYIAGEHIECPSCSKVCEVYSRVVGYIRPVNQWNLGKVEEFKERKTFKLLNMVEVT